MNRASPFTAIAGQLVRRAETLARAHGENALHRRADDGKRWRIPRFVWPIFTRESR